MALSPNPRLIVVGNAHQVRKTQTRVSESQPVARECAFVVVLTEEGGFLEVYYGPDHVGALPAQGDEVAITIDCYAGLGTGSQGGRFAELRCRYVGEANPAEDEKPALKTA